MTHLARMQTENVVVYQKDPFQQLIFFLIFFTCLLHNVWILQGEIRYFTITV